MCTRVTAETCHVADIHGILYVYLAICFRSLVFSKSQKCLASRFECTPLKIRSSRTFDILVVCTVICGVLIIYKTYIHVCQFWGYTPFTPKFIFEIPRAVLLHIKSLICNWKEYSSRIYSVSKQRKSELYLFWAKYKGTTFQLVKPNLATVSNCSWLDSKGI